MAFVPGTEMKLEHKMFMVQMTQHLEMLILSRFIYELNASTVKTLTIFCCKT